MKTAPPAANTTDSRRDLPSTSALLETAAVKVLLEEHPRPFVVEAVRAAVEWFRGPAAASGIVPEVAEVAGRVADFLGEEERQRLRPVVNATGIILHTGLGRAVLPKRAVQALAQLDGCCNLQIDLEAGERGKRNFTTERLLCRLTGAEAALVVNNNAAATLLLLTVLCAGKEVIVSRGQLIEIGGSFRLPDCIHQSGAKLVEVGTTNKTQLRDYEAALTENTAAVLRVNPSNYKVIGFTKSVASAELVKLKKRQPLLVLDDLGCGALVNLEDFGLPHEPTVQESVAAGADLVCFSGDKLIGGPQAGIIVGRRELVQRIKKHPLTRMLRIGKLEDMALEHTLRLFLEPRRLREEHPTLRMLALPAARLKQRAQELKRVLDASALPLECSVRAVEGAMGGGSLPGVAIPSYAVAVSVQGLSADALARQLRQQEPPIIARIHEDNVLLDLRTVLEGEERAVADALRN
ncbi:MAG: L-seryl-tRNA(Sec) selenium transferase, partial [Candidatus Hydrogenedentes bacterium]|nr:L-seryl-tRNA(Sec) selenium transferase [Candidatus Hydrogenedentota bacterium]